MKIEKAEKFNNLDNKTEYVNDIKNLKQENEKKNFFLRKTFSG